MGNFKISIIIPTYNTGNLLKEAMNSIISQTLGFENLEVIFVDDNSNDKITKKLIKEYDSKYSNCKSIFLDENSGFPGKPRNIGINNANSNYLMIMDHDDSYSATYCEELYDKINETNCDFVFSNFEMVFPNNTTHICDQEFLNQNEIVINSITENLDFLTLTPAIWTKIFKKEFINKNNIKFPEGVLAEDVYFFIALLIYGEKIVYLPDNCGYKYKIRNTEEDKSTIHIKNKKYLSAMIKGYFKTLNLLEKTNNLNFYDIIFRHHLRCWLDNFIDSSLNVKYKNELLNEISPLFKKELYEDNEELEIYYLLSTYIRDNKFNQAIILSNKIKKYRQQNGLLNSYIESNNALINQLDALNNNSNLSILDKFKNIFK